MVLGRPRKPRQSVNPADTITRPDGTHFTLADLPTRDRRWKRHHMMDVVLAVENKKLDLVRARTQFRLSPEEFEDWRTRFAEGGLAGLERVKTTHVSPSVLESDARVELTPPHSQLWELGTLVECMSVLLLYRPFGAPSIAAVNHCWIPLTPTELACLELLVKRSGTVVTPRMFFDYVYPSEKEEPSWRMLDVLISVLRKKLGQMDHALQKTELIETFQGRGYCIDRMHKSRSIGWLR